jgi:hypothetical protein
MKCREFQKHYVELLDTRPEAAARPGLGEHLESCPACAEFYAEARQASGLLEVSHPIHASNHFKEQVMYRIAEIERVEAQSVDPAATSRPSSFPGARKLAWAAAAAMIALAAVSTYNWIVAPNGQAPGFSVLARAAEVMKGLRSVYIRAEMRGVGHDNFDFMSPDHDLIPVELWKELEEPGRWRVEKSGRVVVMDGESSVLLIRPRSVLKIGPGATGLVGWLEPLLNLEMLLGREVWLAQSQGSTLKLENQTAPDGAAKTVVTVTASAQGDFSQSDYTKNKSITESDNIRVYIFDAETNRLEDLSVYMRTEEDRILVFKIAEIEYDVALDPGLFSLEIPEDAVSMNRDPNAPPQETAIRDMTPQEFARYFFEALGREDWEAVSRCDAGLAKHPVIRKNFGGVEIISLGEAFQSGIYPGWFVPYEIRLKSGETKKHNLAVRNDGRRKEWRVDGGF